MCRSKSLKIILTDTDLASGFAFGLDELGAEAAKAREGESRKGDDPDGRAGECGHGEREGMATDEGFSFMKGEVNGSGEADEADGELEVEAMSATPGPTRGGQEGGLEGGSIDDETEGSSFWH